MHSFAYSYNVLYSDMQGNRLMHLEPVGVEEEEEEEAGTNGGEVEAEGSQEAGSDTGDDNSSDSDDIF